MGNNHNSLTVGPRGSVVFEDIRLFEKTAHFNRERIPERIVHAKGSGPHGYFVCTHRDIAKYTTAKLFSAVGKKTPILPENEAESYHINPFDLTKVWPHKDYPIRRSR